MEEEKQTIYRSDGTKTGTEEIRKALETYFAKAEIKTSRFATVRTRKLHIQIDPLNIKEGDENKMADRLAAALSQFNLPYEIIGEIAFEMNRGYTKERVSHDSGSGGLPRGPAW